MVFTYANPLPAHADFRFLNGWGELGSEAGQLDNPAGVAVDSSGDVYVSDRWNDRIQKFDPNGGFITKWGIRGAGDGQFHSPAGLAIDPNDNIYVVDNQNHRVQKFDSEGNFITKWGTHGIDAGQFIYPGGIAMDQVDGSVYVTDSNRRVQKFHRDGIFITQWGSYGTKEGEFKDTAGVAVDNFDGSVYVADYGNQRIQKFNSEGEFMLMWGYLFTEFQICTHSCLPGSKGSREGQFDGPEGIAVDDFDGAVYVADAGNQRMQKFTSDGAFTFMWGWGVGGESNQFQTCVSSCQAGIEGDGDGQFFAPEHAAIDRDSGHIYVSDRVRYEKNSYQIQSFSEPRSSPTTSQPVTPPDASEGLSGEAGASASAAKPVGSDFGDRYKNACKLILTSPKIKNRRSDTVRISARDAYRLFSKGAKGHIKWGSSVTCKKVRMTILRKRGKSLYLPGTETRVPSRYIQAQGLTSKGINFIEKKSASKLEQKQLPAKGQTRVSLTALSGRSRSGRAALRALRRERFKGTFLVIYTAEAGSQSQPDKSVDVKRALTLKVR